MKLNHIPLFSIPVTYGTIGKDCNDLNTALIEDIIHETNKETELRSGVGVKQSKGSLNA